MGVLERDALGRPALERPALGVAGQEDGVDARARGVSRTYSASCRSTRGAGRRGRRTGRGRGRGRARCCPLAGGAPGVARPAPREAAGEHVEHQAEAEPLVRLRPAHRQDRAERRVVEDRRVGRRLPLRVEQPALGDGPLVDVVDADLALGHDARAEVEDDRVAGGRHRRAERVGAEPGLDPAGGRHPLAGAVVVDRGDQDQARLGRPLGILAEPADVPAVARRARRQPERLRLGEDQVEQPVRLDLAEAPLAVAGDHGGRLVLDLQRDAGAVGPLLDEVDVLRHAHHAVRVVPPEVGPDQAARPRSGPRPRGPRRRRTGGSRTRSARVRGTSGIAGSPGWWSARDFDLTRPRDICNPGPTAFEWAGRPSLPTVPHASRQRSERSITPWRTGSDTESRGGRTVYTLHDDATGASAAVLPSYGFNLFSLKLPGGRPGARGPPGGPRLRREPAQPGPQRHPDPVPLPEPDRAGALHVRRQGLPAPAQLQAPRDPRVRDRRPLGRRRARGRRRRGVHRRPLPDLEAFARDAAVLADRRRPADPLRPVGPPPVDDHHGEQPDRRGTPLRVRHPPLLPPADRARRRPGADAGDPARRRNTGSSTATSRPARSARSTTGSISARASPGRA